VVLLSNKHLIQFSVAKNPAKRIKTAKNNGETTNPRKSPKK
jgi:hypothetical protein